MKKQTLYITLLLAIAIALAIPNTASLQTRVGRGASTAGGGGGILLSKAGTLNEPGSTGNQSITGIGFQPKVVLFKWNRATADGIASHAEIGFGVGISSSSRRAISFRSTDGGSPSQHGAVNRSGHIYYLAIGGSSTADFVSQDTDGFTINWLLVSGGGFTIDYLALGGTSISNVALGTLAAKTTTGTQAYTGIGFQPTALMIFAGKWSSDNIDSTTNGAFTFGFGTSSTERGVIAERSKNGANPQVAKHRQSTSKIALSLTDTGTAIEADLTSFDADGFTLNYPTVSGVADVAYYLVLRGPSVKVGAFNQATSTGNQAVTGLTFEPKALILASTNDTSANNDATQANGTVSIGWASGTTARSSIWAGDSDAVVTTQTDKDIDRTKIIKMFTPGSSPTLNAAADLNSFDSGGFTLNWVTADATARQIIYLALGN